MTRAAVRLFSLFILSLLTTLCVAAVDPLTRLHHPLGNLPDEAAAEDHFGNAMAIDGDTAVIGMALDNVGGLVEAGSAFVYTRVGQQWVQQAKLIAPTPTAYASFGSAVDIDGDTIVVGASKSDFGETDAGQAFVFVRSGNSWSNQATMSALEPRNNSLFGSAVSVDGDLIVVGAPRAPDASNLRRGNAEVFTRLGSLWTRRERLTNDAGEGDFGTSVAVFGNSFVIGAASDTTPGMIRSGQAYVYRKPTVTSIVREAVLFPSGGMAGDSFGTAVAMSGNTVVVGAPYADQVSALNEGAVFVFERNPDSSWSERTVLHAPTATPGLGLGIAVDLQSGTALVGARGFNVDPQSGFGAAWIFTGSGANWTRSADLMPAASIGQYRAVGAAVALGTGFGLVGASDSQIGLETAQGTVLAFTGSQDNWSRQSDVVLRTGQQDALFGHALALSPDGNLLAVGTPAGVYQPDAPERRGLVMIYRRSPELGWRLEATVTSPTPQSTGYFGLSVSLSNDTLLVGAPFESSPGMERHGRAYLFGNTGNAWQLIATLTSPQPRAFAQFGYSVSLDYNQLAVGAPNDLVNQIGRVHVFRSSAGSWVLDASLTGSNSHISSDFGKAVSLDGVRLAVGAPNQMVGGINGRGAVYVFTQQNGNWNMATSVEHSTFDSSANALQARFGASVSLRYPYMVVGAPEFARNGAVFGFHDSGLGLSNTFDYVLSSSDIRARFGNSVAVAGEDLLVGAPGAELAPGQYNSGKVFLFERDPNAQWLERLTVTASGEGIQLGLAVAGNVYDIAYGAPLDPGTAPRGNPGEGTVYVQDKILNFKDGFE